jgi:nicotinamidase-related amidase
MTPTKTALLVIDMQNDVLRHIIPTGENVIAPVKRAVEGCRAKGVHVVYCLRVHRADGIDVEKFRLKDFQKEPFLVRDTPGAAVVSDLTPVASDHQILKSRFNSFFQTDLQLLLTRLGIETVVVCGVQTPNCVRGTAVQAIEFDYDVILLTDAITALTPEIHEANIYDMQHMGAAVRTVDSFLASL